MWIDCVELNKLVNLDNIKSFDVVRRHNDMSDVFDVKIVYSDDSQDDVIFTGTFEECIAKKKSIQEQITILEMEVVATIRQLSQNIALSTMKPNAPGFKPHMDVPSPEMDMKMPEGLVDDTPKQNTEPIKRIFLHVLPAHYPPIENSSDERGVKGAGIVIKNMMRVIYRIRENELVGDDIPEWYTKQDGDFLFTISKNMARETELKQMADSYGFVNMIE